MYRENDSPTQQVIRLASAVPGVTVIPRADGVIDVWVEDGWVAEDLWAVLRAGSQKYRWPSGAFELNTRTAGCPLPVWDEQLRYWGRRGRHPDAPPPPAGWVHRRVAWWEGTEPPAPGAHVGPAPWWKRLVRWLTRR